MALLVGHVMSELQGPRYTVVSWEKGEKYPNAEHLKDFIALTLEQQAFPRGQEAEAVRAAAAFLRVPPA